PNAYGESKALSEVAIRSKCFPSEKWVIVRPTSIWGPWFDVPYKQFFLAVAKGHYIHPKNLHIRKSFGYVGNTVRQLEKILSARTLDVTGRTFYLADHPPIDVLNFAQRIQQATGAPNI